MAVSKAVGPPGTRPAPDGVHAIQLELAQDTHLAAEEPPFTLDREKADRLRKHLAEMLRRIEALAPSLAKVAL